MYYDDYELGQLRIDPGLFRRHVRQAPQQMVRRIGPGPDEGGYPTVQYEEKDDPDWTTYAMVGAAVLVVGGGIWYAKKKKMI
jgi:LPXTG-motif cell wall-anchored protein